MRSLTLLCLFAVSVSLFAAAERRPREKKKSADVRAVGITIKTQTRSVLNSIGTTIDLSVTQRGKFILDVDAKASKLDGFTDDKGTNLNEKRSEKAFPRTVNGISELVEDFADNGESCAISISATGVPSEGAGKIRIKGSLALLCGSEEKSTDQQEIALDQRGNSTIGDFKVTVLPSMKLGGLFSVRSSEPNMKVVEFFDDKGQAITPARRVRRYTSSTRDGKRSAVLSYRLPVNLDTVSFKIVYFSKIETVTVPFDVRVGLDLK